MILSARYGFRWPEVLSPGTNNVTFNKILIKPISVQRVIHSAHEKGPVGYDEIIIVAGKKCIEMARQAFPGKMIHKP